MTGRGFGTYPRSTLPARPIDPQTTAPSRPVLSTCFKPLVVVPLHLVAVPLRHSSSLPPPPPFATQPPVAGAPPMWGNRATASIRARRQCRLRATSIPPCTPPIATHPPCHPHRRNKNRWALARLCAGLSGWPGLIISHPRGRGAPSRFNDHCFHPAGEVPLRGERRSACTRQAAPVGSRRGSDRMDPVGRGAMGSPHSRRQPAGMCGGRAVKGRGVAQLPPVTPSPTPRSEHHGKATPGGRDHFFFGRQIWTVRSQPALVSEPRSPEHFFRHRGFISHKFCPAEHPRVGRSLGG